jgi:hypothetical protein
VIALLTGCLLLLLIVTEIGKEGGTNVIETGTATEKGRETERETEKEKEKEKETGKGKEICRHRRFRLFRPYGRFSLTAVGKRGKKENVERVIIISIITPIITPIILIILLISDRHHRLYRRHRGQLPRFIIITIHYHLLRARRRQGYRKPDL